MCIIGYLLFYLVPILQGSPLSLQIEDAAAASHFASSLTNDPTTQGHIVSVIRQSSSSNETDASSRARLACLISDLVFNDYEDGEEGYFDKSFGQAYTDRTEINWYVVVVVA